MSSPGGVLPAVDVYKRQLLHGLHALHHFGRHHLRHRKRPYDAQRAPDQHLHDGNRRHAEYLAPVSYTHLDVYKRQTSRRRWGR